MPPHLDGRGPQVEGAGGGRATAAPRCAGRGAPPRPVRRFPHRSPASSSCFSPRTPNRLHLLPGRHGQVDLRGVPEVHGTPVRVGQPDLQLHGAGVEAVALLQGERVGQPGRLDLAAAAQQQLRLLPVHADHLEGLPDEVAPLLVLAAGEAVRAGPGRQEVVEEGLAPVPVAAVLLRPAVRLRPAGQGVLVVPVRREEVQLEQGPAQPVHEGVDRLPQVHQLVLPVHVEIQADQGGDEHLRDAGDLLRLQEGAVGRAGAGGWRGRRRWGNPSTPRPTAPSTARCGRPASCTCPRAPGSPAGGCRPCGRTAGWPPGSG